MFRIRRRLVRWALLVIGLPVLGLALHRIADELEARRGASEVSRRLHQAGSIVDRVRRLV
jgi:hypothetical protein